MANLRRIKELAEAKNISIRELAERVGLKENRMHVIVKTNSTKIETLEKIAKELDVPVSCFFEEDVIVKEHFEQRGNNNLQAKKIDKVEIKNAGEAHDNKPTYEDLEAKVSELQQKLLEAKDKIISLMESNERRI